MAFLPSTTDYYLEVAKGNVPGTSSVIVRGHNADIDSTPEEDVWEAGGDLTFLSAAETMEIASTDIDDTSAGTGAQTVLIEGVDGTGAAASETVSMNGTANVTTSLSYLRVNVMTVLTAGTSGWNEGNITATATTAATIQDEMDATESISQASHHTIPLGKTGYLLQVELNAAKISGGGNPEIEFKGYARPFGGAWLMLFDKKLDTAVTDEIDIRPNPPAVMPARTDVRMRAASDTNNTEVRTRMYLLIVDD